MRMIKIKWDITDKAPLKVKYYFNGKSMGNDDEGVERIIQLIKDDTKAEGISFTGRSTGSNISGEALESTLPFYKYWETLMLVIGNRKMKLDIT